MFPLHLFWWVFILNGCWILSNAFLHLLAFVFSFVDVGYHIDLHMLNCPVPGMNSTCSRCMILLIYYWILFANILLRFLYYIRHRYWHVIFFFCIVFVWFWYSGVGGFIEWLWEYSLLFSLLKELEKYRYEFFVCLVEFPSEAIRS